MPNTSIKLLAVAFLFLNGSCREFYDEEFLEDEASLQQAQNRSFETTLLSTDPNLTSISGDSQVEINDGEVQVNVKLDGIPQNIGQLHYGFINSACSLLNITVPNEAGATRSYTISETLSAAALQTDLLSSGAATSANDINLEGKSFIVKAIPNFSGIPNPAGTNSVTIACGELGVSEAETSTTDPFNPQDNIPDTTTPTDPFGRDPANTDPFGRPPTTNTSF